MVRLNLPKYWPVCLTQNASKRMRMDLNTGDHRRRDPISLLTIVKTKQEKIMGRLVLILMDASLRQARSMFIYQAIDSARARPFFFALYNALSAAVKRSSSSTMSGASVA